MTNFFVIKKNKLYVVFTLILLVAVILYLNNNFFASTSATFFTDNTTSSKNEIHMDFNGDGENEILQINDESGKYSIKIISKTSEYLLKLKDGAQYFNSTSKVYPLKVSTIDLSRDGIPEIIIRTYHDDTPINYIFAYQKDCYTNILTSYTNIIGIVNSQNTKTPNIVTLESDKGDESVNSFIYNNSKLKNISFNKHVIPGLTPIQNFIDIVQSPYIPSDLPDIFTNDISSTDVSILWSFDKDSNNYNFQSGYFLDIKWNKKGEIVSIEWTLSFSEINKTSSQGPNSEILIKLVTTQAENNSFKISSVKKL